MTNRISEQNMLAIDCIYDRNQWIGVGDPSESGTGFDQDGDCHLVIADKDDPYNFKSVCIKAEDVTALRDYLTKILGE